MTDLRWFLTVLLPLLLLPTFAQQKADTTYTFRFVPQKDMFYVPWNGNGEELERLLTCVKQNRHDILGKKLPVLVDGYCNSHTDRAGNLATAKIRANRVKTELILRAGLTEDCFVTHNHATEGDYVTVRITLPATHTGTVSEPESRHTDIVTAEPADSPEQADETVQAPPTESHDARQEAIADRPAETKGPANYHLAVRTNLLRWATLTPDLGVEWRICPSWGIAVNGSWTSWNWSDKGRRYAHWEVAPEVRYYMGEKNAWYVGAMFKTGEFNYKLSETGKQGDLMGGGITAGYQLRLNKALALDFNLGLGYLNADYEKYEVIDGVRVHRGNETKDWWGPINAGVTLVWKIK